MLTEFLLAFLISVGFIAFLAGYLVGTRHIYHEIQKARQEGQQEERNRQDSHHRLKKEVL